MVRTTQPGQTLSMVLPLRGSSIKERNGRSEKGEQHQIGLRFRLQRDNFRSEKERTMQISAAKAASIGIRTLILAGLTVMGVMTQIAPAAAQMPKIKVGRTIGGSGFHIPSYIAIDKGLFKAEGLDADS